MIGEVRLGRLDAVLVWKLDRAFRSTQDALVFLDDLKGWNADFVLTTEGRHHNARRKMLFTMFAAFAEFESARLVKRVRAGMANAMAKGVHVGRPRLADNERLMARFRRCVRLLRRVRFPSVRRPNGCASDRPAWLGYWSRRAPDRRGPTLQKAGPTNRSESRLGTAPFRCS